MIAVIGGAGQLGSALVRLIGSDAATIGRAELDLTEPDTIGWWLDTALPDLVINCAAYTNVDAAESDQEAAYLLNAEAVGRLAQETASRDLGFVTFSTDYVFDGQKGAPYVEGDEPNPINVYGASKLAGERMALEANPSALVVRTSWLLSGTHPNFAATILRLLAGGPVSVVDDQVGRPTLADDLAIGVMAAVENDVSGLLHLTNQGATTWCGLAREIAALTGVDPARVRPITTEDSGRAAPRPPDSRLDSERLQPLGLSPLPHYRAALETAVRSLLATGVIV